MNEKLKQLKALLDATEGTGELLVPIADLREMIATVEAVTAPNMRLAMGRFQVHIDGLNDRLASQVGSINRLLKMVEDLKAAAK